MSPEQYAQLCRMEFCLEELIEVMNNEFPGTESQRRKLDTIVGKLLNLTGELRDPSK